MNSLLVMVKCRWLEFRREPSAFYYVIFFPIIAILCLGSIFNSPDPKPHLIGLDSQSVFNKAVYDLRQHNEFKVIDGDVKTLEKSLIQGKIQLIVRFTPKEIIFNFDPKNNDARFARLGILDVARNSEEQTPKIQIQDNPVSSSGMRYVDFLIPGLLAFSIISTSMFGTGQLIVSNRRDNLLKRFFVTPMKPSTYITSQILGRLIILLIEATVILTCGWLVFDFKVQGSMTLFLLFTALGAATFTALAIAAAARTSNSSAYAGIVNAIVMPLALIGGVWFSREYLPNWLNLASGGYSPLSILVDSLRAIALERTGLRELWPQAMKLGFFTLLFSIYSIRRFKWY
jgi:ABC-2 type transport system permease protein